DQLNGRTVPQGSGAIGALLADAALRDTARESVARSEAARDDGHNKKPESFDQLMGNSPAIERVRQRIARVAPTALSVLINGDSGSGKALVARALHERSRVADGPFITLNCGA